MSEKEDLGNDPVHYPRHYTAHSSGVECVDIAEHLSFNLGNALKYVWRCEHKGRKEEDLKKALWYVRREKRLVSLTESPQIDPMIALYVQKTLDAEESESTLGKFLQVLSDELPVIDDYVYLLANLESVLGGEEG